MECFLCGHQKTHKHGKTSNVLDDIIVLNAYKLSPILLTLSIILKTIQPEQMPIVLYAHIEDSSLRGISRTVNLADNTVVTLVRAPSEKGQMIHNAHLQNINTSQISSDEFWSFVQKNENSASIRN